MQLLFDVLSCKSTTHESECEYLDDLAIEKWAHLIDKASNEGGQKCLPPTRTMHQFATLDTVTTTRYYGILFV